MKKTLKTLGIALGLFVVLVFLFILYLAVYPELSEVRKQCDQVEIGMSKEQAVAILEGLINDKSDIVVNEKKILYVMKNGVDCQVELNESGVVTDVTSGVDSF